MSAPNPGSPAGGSPAPATPYRRKASELPSLETAIVRVRRQPGNRHLADYRLADVRRMKWGYISGGMARRSQWHVYGYVMCDGMLSGKIAHSCKHGPPPHRVKVCITKKYNEAVWPLIAAKVGPKPEPRRWRRKARRAARLRAAQAKEQAQAQTQTWPELERREAFASRRPAG